MSVSIECLRACPNGRDGCPEPSHFFPRQMRRTAGDSHPYLEDGVGIREFRVFCPPQRHLVGGFTGMMGLAVAVLFSSGQLCATEYFVSKTGSDANDGISREEAFATVQKGVDALEAGDVLTIGPGEYAESVHRENLGNAEKETVILAAIPGTALLRGDAPVGPFVKAEGLRNVYVAVLDREIFGVNETDTLTVLDAMPNLSELEAAPGRWYYDRPAKKLFVSATDFKAADTHHYTVSVVDGDGLYLANPTRVVIEGLAATGFNNVDAARALPARTSHPGIRAVWGILISKGKSCVVRDCVAYLNGGGIGLNNGQDSDDAAHGSKNVIERCVAYGNFSPTNVSTGNLALYFPDADEIRDSLTYKSRGVGVQLHQQLVNPAKVVRNTGWGHNADFHIKTGQGKDGEVSRIENCVSLGFLDIRSKPAQSISRDENIVTKDNIFLGEQNLVSDQEFADPENFDFRLQETSQFRGSGPDGQDRGPHPYVANVYFVSPDGDDGANGLSMQAAWKTPGHAFQKLKAGDTLYLAPGRYAGNLDVQLKGEEGRPVTIRGRGSKPVLIEGALRLKNSAAVEMQRLNFADEVALDKCVNVEFQSCQFFGAESPLVASEASTLKVTHCTFTEFSTAAIDLARCSGVHLAGNLFNNVTGVAVRVDDASAVAYSDYNSYAKRSKAWESGRGEVREACSREVVPQFAKRENIPQLENAAMFSAGGPLGKPIGTYRESIRSKQPELIDLALHSVSETTANLQWMTSQPASCEIAWGETEACENRDTFDALYSASYSITGLKPGRKYFFRVNSLRSPLAFDKDSSAPRVEVKDRMISFSTAEKNAAPVTYYVAPEGDDQNDGKSRASAFQTIRHAAGRVNVGDTVLIAGGTYQERVRIPATGTKDAPISFKAMPGERVVIDGRQKSLNSGFFVTGKNHLRFDGLYFQEFSFVDGRDAAWWPLWMNGEIVLYRCKDIEITRCFSDGRSTAETASFVNAWKVENLLVRNCVITNKMTGMMLSACPELRVENNVFAVNMVTAFVLNNDGKENTFVENNIFTDNLAKKAVLNIPIYEMDRSEALRQKNNCYFLRGPFEDRTLFFFVEHAGRKHVSMTVPTLEKELGPIHPLFADPGFQGLSSPENRAASLKTYPPDLLMDRNRRADITDYFATNPELISRKVGLIPQDFQDARVERIVAPAVVAPTK